MKAREWLIKEGLAKSGRGKLSIAAHAALKKAIEDGTTFDDYTDGKIIKKDPVEPVKVEVVVEAPKEIKSRPVTHKYSHIWGLDIRGRRPIKIAFNWCACCLVQIKYCSSKVPVLPDWIGGGPGLTKEPTAKEMANVQCLTT